MLVKICVVSEVTRKFEVTPFDGILPRGQNISRLCKIPLNAPKIPLKQLKMRSNLV